MTRSFLMSPQAGAKKTDGARKDTDYSHLRICSWRSKVGTTSCLEFNGLEGTCDGVVGHVVTEGRRWDKLARECWQKPITFRVTFCWLETRFQAAAKSISEWLRTRL